MKKILFVCTGNTCRSSMAEGFLKSALAEDKTLENSFSVLSAGLAACDGQPASQYSIQVLKDEWGIDLTSHRAKSLKMEHLKDVFLILTMTHSHKQALISAFPEIRAKTYTLKEFLKDEVNNDLNSAVPNNMDITDPFGGSVETYRKCALEIKSAVDTLVKKLKKYDK